MASLPQWIWVWASTRRWWWTDREAWHAAVHGVTKSQTRLSKWTTTTVTVFRGNHNYILVDFFPQYLCVYVCINWRRQWQPTPVLLPGKSHEQRSLVGCSPWGCKESDTTEQLHFHFHFHALEKEIAIHSSALAWRIPGTGEPGGLPSMGLYRVGHDWSDLAAAQLPILFLQSMRVDDYLVIYFSMLAH